MLITACYISIPRRGITRLLSMMCAILVTTYTSTSHPQNTAKLLHLQDIQYLFIFIGLHSNPWRPTRRTKSKINLAWVSYATNPIQNACKLSIPSKWICTWTVDIVPRSCQCLWTTEFKVDPILKLLLGKLLIIIGNFDLIIIKSNGNNKTVLTNKFAILFFYLAVLNS